MKEAVYAGSFDPVTYGHIDIISRAARMADRLRVAIGVNVDKRYMFSLSEREELLRRSIAHIHNATVESFRGLLVQYAYEQDIPYIIRGVRGAPDAETECTLATLNRTQGLDVETVMLPANPLKSHISSSAAKAIQKEHGDVDSFVPLPVKEALEARMSGQYFLGITGASGVGKTTICNALKDAALRRNVPMHHIELDVLGHEILGDSPEPGYKKIRKTVADAFGAHLIKDDTSIDRKLLGPIVFGDPEKLDQLNRIMHTPLRTKLRDRVYGLKGLILLDAAILPEMGLMHLTNNNLLLVEADEATLRSRLESRDDLSPDQVENRLKSQLTGEKKANIIQEAIQHDHHGTLIRTESELSEEAVNRLLDQMIETVDVYGKLQKETE